MSLHEKAEALLKEAEQVAEAPMLQQLNKAKVLLPKIGKFVVEVAFENERRRVECENLRFELKQLKAKLVGVIGHGA